MGFGLEKRARNTNPQAPAAGSRVGEPRPTSAGDRGSAKRRTAARGKQSRKRREERCPWGKKVYTCYYLPFKGPRIEKRGTPRFRTLKYRKSRRRRHRSNLPPRSPKAAAEGVIEVVTGPQRGSGAVLGCPNGPALPSAQARTIDLGSGRNDSSCSCGSRAESKFPGRAIGRRAPADLAFALIGRLQGDHAADKHVFRQT